MAYSRFQTFEFKNGKTAQNRVVIPPMASQTADNNGFVTEATLQHYERLTEAKSGLIFVEYSYIHKSGRGELNQLGVDSSDKVEGLMKLASILKKHGSLVGLQLVHTGGKTTSEITGGPLLGASEVAVPVKGWQPDIPHSMKESEILELTNWYVDSAILVESAGFDLVELHAAHGYGLNQWLSPLTNQRSDSYGGSIENRSRLLLEIVKQIKQKAPNLLLTVRMPAQDHVHGGLDVQEMVCVASQLEILGVDLIDVSSGIGGWRRLDNRNNQGYLVDDAATLKTHLNIPVIGVGGIEAGDFIDQILQDKKVDFAAVGRAILKNPAVWGKTHLCNLIECQELVS